MIMEPIYPIILSGGSGQRLWPVSRKNLPKQFSTRIGGKTLLELTLERTAFDFFTKPIIVTTLHQYKITKSYLQSLQKPAQMIVEPYGKNTGASILSAAYFLYKTNKDALMCVMPSDHLLPDKKYYAGIIKECAEQAQDGSIVTLGASPSYPATGYGYINHEGAGRFRKVLSFTEKPDQSTALRMLRSGNYLWNMGIFTFTAQTVVTLAQQYAPEMLHQLEKCVDNSNIIDGDLSLDEENWHEAENISFDHLIVEKASNIKTFPYPKEWSDLGDWLMLSNQYGKDDSDNTLVGQSIELECEKTTLWSNEADMQVVGIGLENTTVVATRDAVLIANNSNLQLVKDAVLEIEKKGLRECLSSPVNPLSRGNRKNLSTYLAENTKTLTVKPNERFTYKLKQGKQLSLMTLAGNGMLHIGESTTFLKTGKTAELCSKDFNVIENNGDSDLLLFEFTFST